MMSLIPGPAAGSPSVCDSQCAQLNGIWSERQQSTSPGKLTIPQKRRRRLQRSAVRHAQVNSDALAKFLDLPSRECADKSAASATSVTCDMIGRLDSIENKLAQAISLVMRACVSDFSFQMNPYERTTYSTEQSEGERKFGETLPQLEPFIWDVYATEFVPEKAPFAKNQGDFRSVPQPFWESLYACFDQAMSSDRGPDECSDTSAEHSSMPDDGMLEVVWLPLNEWRRATNLLQLDVECIRRTWRDGMRDYDNMKWYKYLPETLLSDNRHLKTSSNLEAEISYWQPAEIQIWTKVTLKMAHQAVEKGLSVGECEAIIDRRWSEAKVHIQPELHASIEEVIEDVRRSTKNLHDKRLQLSAPQEASDGEEGLLQGSIVNEVEETLIVEKCATLDARLNSILDFVDAVDAGHFVCPETAKKFALTVARDTYDWKQKRRSSSELSERIACLDETMNSITREAQRNRP